AIGAASGAAARAGAESGDAAMARREEIGVGARTEGAESAAPAGLASAGAVAGTARSTTWAQAAGPGSVAAKAARVRRAHNVIHGERRLARFILVSTLKV